VHGKRKRKKRKSKKVYNRYYRLEDPPDEAKEVTTELMCTLGMAFLTGAGI